MAKSKTAPQNPITVSEINEAIECLNLLFNSASGNLPPGLVPSAREAQIKGLKDAGQTVVTLLDKAHSPCRLCASRYGTYDAERRGQLSAMLDVFKIVGVNGTVIGVVTLTDFELILKVTLLVVTIVWTIGKATNEWQTWHRRQRQRKKN
jgi:hypothetical protein